MNSRRLSCLIVTAAMIMSFLGSNLSVSAGTFSMSDFSAQEAVICNASNVSGFSTSSGIGGFVNRLYSLALKRGIDQEGFLFWCNKLKNGEDDGSNIARGIFYSREFVSKRYSPDEYISIIYGVFFDRPADPSGYNYWMGQISSGKSYEEVLECVMASQEWSNVCCRFGIVSGNGNKPTDYSISSGVTTFVTGLYRDILGRAPESSGINYWSDLLASYSISGRECAKFFFYSDEFNNNVYPNLNNEQLVKLFYQVVLGREPEAGGFNYWMSQISGKSSRDEKVNILFEGIIGSAEFSSLCTRNGIMANFPNSPRVSPEFNTFMVPVENGYVVVSGRFDVAAENDIISRVNALRASYGRDALSSGTDIQSVARYRAVELVVRTEHTRPNNQSWSTFYREKLPNNSARGENIAAGCATGEQFFGLWRNSSGHFSNMINPAYRQIGVGVFIPYGSYDTSRFSSYAVQSFCA